MKKFISSILILMFLLSTVNVFAADTVKPIKIFVNDQEYAPASNMNSTMTQNGRTYVDAKFIGSLFNFKVNTQNNVITMIKESIRKTIVFTMGSNVLKNNGRNFNMDVKTIIVNGNLMIPIKYFSDCIGSPCNWTNAKDYYEIGLWSDIIPNSKFTANTVSFAVSDNIDTYSKPDQQPIAVTPKPVNKDHFKITDTGKYLDIVIYNLDTDSKKSLENAIKGYVDTNGDRGVGKYISGQVIKAWDNRSKIINAVLKVDEGQAENTHQKWQANHWNTDETSKTEFVGFRWNGQMGSFDNYYYQYIKNSDNIEVMISNQLVQTPVGMAFTD